jgi:hypothetical protein
MFQQRIDRRLKATSSARLRQFGQAEKRRDPAVAEPRAKKSAVLLFLVRRQAELAKAELDGRDLAIWGIPIRVDPGEKVIHRERRREHIDADDCRPADREAAEVFVAHLLCFGVWVGSSKTFLSEPSAPFLSRDREDVGYGELS